MAKRFQLSDLRTPGARGPSGRAVDGFTNPAAATPDFTQGIIDVTPLGNAIANDLDKKAKQDGVQREKDGEQFARENSEDLARLQDAISVATDGLTDESEIADAQSGALRKLTEAGLLPPQANPRWLVGVKRASTEATLNDLSRRMTERIGEFSALTDENADQLDSPEALEAIRAEFQAISESPLVAGSRTARNLVDEFRSEFEPAFMDEVSKLRGQAQEENALVLRSQQRIEGFRNPEGGFFMGIGSLGDASVDPDIAIASIRAGLDYQRNEESVPNVHLEFMDDLATWADQNIDDNPAAVRRALSRVGELELTPGVSIDSDTRPEVARINDLRRRAEAAETDELRKNTETRRIVRGEIETIYRGQFALNLEENPDLSLQDLTDKTFADLEGNESFQAVMVDSGLDAIPDEVRGSLLAQSRADKVTGLQQSRATDSPTAAQLRLFIREGGDPGLADAYAASVLSPQGLLEWKKSGTQEAWNQLKQAPGFARVQVVTSVDALPQGLNTEATRALRGAQSEASERIHEIASRLLREGKDPGEALGSPEVTSILDKVASDLQAAQAPITANREQYLIARERGDVGAMDESLKAMRGLVDPKTYQTALVDRQRVAKQVDNVLVNDQVYRSAQSSLSRTISVHAENTGLDSASAAELGAELNRQFTLEMRDGTAEVAKVPVEQQGAKRAELIQIARQKAMDTVLTKEQQTTIRTAIQKGASAAAKQDEALRDFADFKATSSIRAVVGGLLEVPQVLDDPQSTIGFFERSTPARLFERTIQKATASTIGTSLTGSPTELSKVLGIAGAFSPQQVMDGSSVTVPVRIADLRADGVFLGPFRKTLSEEQVADLEEVGITAKKAGGVFGDEYTFSAEAKDLHPTLSIFFKTPQAASIWLSTTTDADRKAFYTKLGLDTVDLKASDTSFLKRQTSLLKRYK